MNPTHPSPEHKYSLISQLLVQQAEALGAHDEDSGSLLGGGGGREEGLILLHIFSLF